MVGICTGIVAGWSGMVEDDAGDFQTAMQSLGGVEREQCVVDCSQGVAGTDSTLNPKNKLMSSSVFMSKGSSIATVKVLPSNFTGIIL